MNFRTKNYLRKRFQDYYNNSDIAMPHDFIKREWGFILFDQMPDIVMRRHVAFSSYSEAVEYIRGMVPAHVYHSAAYYQYPGAAAMNEKQWNGADLIFDLDADHLPPEVRGSSYRDMLYSVKKETDRLLDFLYDDFGFLEDNLSIVFSGGRGYHIHVHDPKVLSLESAQRREIVDYVGGTGLKTEFLFKSEKHKVYDTGKFKKKELESPRRISSFEEGGRGFGWGKRISKYIIQFLKDISNNDEVYGINKTIYLIKNYKKSKIQKIPDNIINRTIQMHKDNIEFEQIANEIGMSKEKVRDILIVNDLWDIRRETIGKLKMMKKIAQSAEGLEMIEKGIIDFPIVTYMFDAIVYNAIEENSVRLGGSHTDEPVTADIKRLIRMPSSLHGGSGMRVVPLTMTEFKKFEPLNDAVVFSRKEIDIDVIPPLKPHNSTVEMKGNSFTVSEGINTLPEYAAIYLMCRGAAEYA